MARHRVHKGSKKAHKKHMKIHGGFKASGHKRGRKHKR